MSSKIDRFPGVRYQATAHDPHQVRRAPTPQEMLTKPWWRNSIKLGALSSLTVLELHLKDRGMKDEAACYLAANLRQVVQLLSLKVDLGKNAIRDEGVRQLGEAIGQLDQLTSRRALALIVTFQVRRCRKLVNFGC